MNETGPKNKKKEAALYSEFISSIEDVIEDARNGRMFILVDAEDRENEGDLIIPAQMATPENVNFMARYGRGLICLALTKDRAKELHLEMMSSDNRTRHQTAFTVSIEARDGVSTGISAHDRARTIAVATDQTKGKDDIVTPGHVFPLIARDGGVLVRTGHTEAAVDIARLAGLYPAGVICEIMNDDGTMARMPDLVKFAQLHGIKVGTIADLIKYRRKHDNLVHRAVETEFESEVGGAWKMLVYINKVEYAEHVVLVKGDLSNGGPPLVRMHASNFFDDVLEMKDDRGSVLKDAMRMVSDEGRGAVVIIRPPEANLISDMLLKSNGGQGQPESLRSYGVGAQILLDLGIHEMVLLSNTEKEIVGLDGYELRIVETRALKGSGN